MASIGKTPYGYALYFRCDGRRKCVRLAGLGEDAAERAKYHVEVALRAHRLSQPISVRTLDWLYHSAPRGVFAALSDLGIVDDRRMLASALHSWITVKVGRVSTRRIEQMERVGAALGKSLGDVELEAITADRLTLWSEQLLEQFARNTVAGHCAMVRQFFAWAVRERLLSESPAGGLSGAFARSERLVEVPGAGVNVLCLAAESTSDMELATALRLARWGGLRAAEVLRVRLEDIDARAMELTVRDTKRQHHGHGSRIVPIFAELRPVLEYAQLRDSDRGAAGRRGLLVPDLGSRTSSAATQRMRRLCQTLQIAMWPRPWQNMRATRESELMDAFSLKDACKWIGNSPDVAMKHYALVRSTEFDRAVGRDSSPRDRSRAGEGHSQ